ncbi:DUF413 domain-containing protein [Ekhidna sp.]|uniref:DUF413 domain-containing protein n=1 Tax=Ekhidna sp. TaxID=2608089 RepID=UPI003CCBEEA8
MPSTKQDHLQYLKEKGQFKIDSKIKNLRAFSDEMIDILEKYGHWFEALIEGKLDPISEKQRMFVDAVKNEHPFSIEEQAWVLYKKRKSLEKGLKDALKRRPSIATDTFYDREDVKILRGAMFGTNVKEHFR